MFEDVQEVIPRMGWFPCYKYPEKMMEDEVFVYYKFSVPFEDDKEGLNLALAYFPVYVGVEPLGEDEKFRYFKCRVPKIFLETISPTLGIPYGLMYDEESLEAHRMRIQESTEEARPGMKIAAGAALSGRRANLQKDELDTLAFETRQFEVVLRCQNTESCGYVHREITSDIWATIYGVVCGKCMGNFVLESCKEIDDEDEKDSF